MDDSFGHATCSESPPLQVTLSRELDSVDGHFDLTKLLVPQSTEGTRRRWGAYLSLHCPSIPIHFDRDRWCFVRGEWPPERHTIAQKLHSRYQVVMRVIESQPERARIWSNYILAQSIVTPIHRLPEEILSAVLASSMEDGTGAENLTSLLGVCSLWYHLLKHIPKLWLGLRLDKWTSREYVDQVLERSKDLTLYVSINTSDDLPTLSTDVPPYAATATAIKSADRWCSLALHSYSGVSDDPPFEPLVFNLQNCLSIIANTAKRLVKLAIWDHRCASFLLHPTFIHIFSALTTLTLEANGRPEAADLLPHLLVVESLSLKRITLPDYDLNAPLRFIDTIRDLSLGHMSIQWMAGRQFKTLESCYIDFPHRHGPIRTMPVHLPICHTFRYAAQTLASLGAFVIPCIVKLMVGNNNSARSQNAIDLKRIQSFCPPRISLRSLQLSIECHDQDLIETLMLLPNLERVELLVSHPRSLGWKFSSSLIQPTCNSKCYHHWWCILLRFTLMEQPIRICPSVKDFIVYYRRWLRRTELEVTLPIFTAAVESRKVFGRPLQSFILGVKESWGVEWTVSKSLGRCMEETFHDPQAICKAFRSAVQKRTIQLMDITPQTAFYLAHHPFSIFLHRITELTISIRSRWSFPDPVDILRHCRRLESLALQNALLSPCSSDKELPLLKTLCKLTLNATSIHWMSGRAFPTLRECRITQPDQKELQQLLIIHLPVCILLEYYDGPLELLSKVHAPHLRSLTIGPIALDSPWQLDPQSRVVYSWVLRFEFPVWWGPLKDELALISRLKMIGPSLVWPERTTGRYLQINALVEQRPVHVDEELTALRNFTESTTRAGTKELEEETEPSP
jgi:hypothetical protein